MSNKLKKEHKWKPRVSLNEGLLKTQKWISENQRKINKLPIFYEHKR